MEQRETERGTRYWPDGRDREGCVLSEAAVLRERDAAVASAVRFERGTRRCQVTGEGLTREEELEWAARMRLDAQRLTQVLRCIRLGVAELPGGLYPGRHSSLAALRRAINSAKETLDAHVRGIS